MMNNFYCSKTNCKAENKTAEKSRIVENMKMARTLVALHTHTHTHGSLNNYFEKLEKTVCDVFFMLAYNNKIINLKK